MIKKKPIKKTLADGKTYPMTQQVDEQTGKIMITTGSPGKRDPQGRMIQTRDLENVLDSNGEPRTGRFRVKGESKKRFREEMEKNGKTKKESTESEESTEN